MTTDRRETTKEMSREGEHSGNATSSRTAPAHESQSQDAPLIQPMPWVAQCDGDGGRIYDANGFLVTANLTADEARFIVRACNSFDDLLAALKLAQVWLANSVPVADIDGPTPLPVIAAAIAKAEGRLS